jgi:hypothetical protein
MSTHVGAYDTSRMYRSGSHQMQEEMLSIAPPPAEVDRMVRAFDDRSAFVSANLRPAASAVVAYSEYLLASASLPRDQQAMLDMLRRQAQTILWGLTALAAPAEEITAATLGAGVDRAIA